MKILSSKSHGIIDYIFVLFLLASPKLFGMEGTLCTITYALGAVHLALTLLTDFEPGLVKVIPFRIHGLIEVVVAVALAALALWFYNQGNLLGCYYYAALSCIILLVFILTDFTGLPAKR